MRRQRSESMTVAVWSSVTVPSNGSIPAHFLASERLTARPRRQRSSVWGHLMRHGVLLQKKLR